MLQNNEPSSAIHVQPALAVAYQRTRLRANAVLLRYGHIIPIVAVAFCLILSTSISIQRQVAYSRAAGQVTTTTTTTTAAPSLLSTTYMMAVKSTSEPAT
ncbi:hypothetical protein Q4I32_007713 [Leishmania shawi]|uniref:Transmembrane protein n=1 Tax=Leishmania shawi TaxID=5680 RepID=A0AAW3BBU4_9TRYP